MKKFSFIMMLVLCMLVSSFIVNAATLDSGYIGNSNIKWSYDGAGVLTISGNGEMPQTSSLNCPWYSYRKSITSVNIGKGITVIGNYAFEDCENLISITIPSGVTRIGYASFLNCKSLENIKLPATMRNIDMSAFEYCESLKSISIPDGVKSISSNAFYCCYALESIELPESVTSVGSEAFYYCKKLKTIELPNELTFIGSYAFYACFGLENILIPESVNSIGDGAFVACNSLNSIIVSEKNQYYCSENNTLFNKNKTKLIKYAAGNKNELYEIPDGVEEICKGAFSNSDNLTKIIFPKSIKNINSFAFESCDNIKRISLKDGIKELNTGIFQSCRGLTDIVMPNTVTVIYNQAFEGCYSLKNVYYTGSESEWECINILTSNKYLINANIIFNYIPMNFEIADYNVGTNSVSVTIYTKEELLNENAITIIALYNNNLLVDVYETNTKDIISHTFKNLPSEISKYEVKAFCWGSLNNLKCLSKHILKNIE